MVQCLQTLPLTPMVREECDSNDGEGLDFWSPCKRVIKKIMAVFIPIQKKGNGKQCSNYHTTALISHAIKVMLKILQAKLQQYVT